MIKPTRYKLSISFVLTSLFALNLLFNNQTFAMSPFKADYQFSYNGKNLGSATRVLTQKDNLWTYTFTASAGGLTSATETSQFNFNQDTIESLNFDRTSKILTHKNNLNINFDPNNQLIQVQKNKNKNSFKWVSNTLDELNAELQVREDIKNQKLKSSYPIVDAKGVAIRKFIQQGNEKVKTKYGTFDTVKVKMQHNKPGRETIFWLAPELDYLPVKVSHVDKNTSYGLLLTDYK